MLRERLSAISSSTGNNLLSQRNVTEGHEATETGISTDLVTVTNRVSSRAVGSSKEESNVINNTGEECENGLMPLHSLLSLKDVDDQAPVCTPVAVARAEVSQHSAGTSTATAENGVSQPFATVRSALPHVGVDSCAKQAERRPCIGAVLVSVNGVRIQVGSTYTWCLVIFLWWGEGVINHSLLFCRVSNDCPPPMALFLFPGVELQKCD